MYKITESEIIYFHKSYLPSKTSTCWNWIKSQNSFGHGQLRLSLEERTVGAHRVAYELHYSKSALNKVVRHKCDNPTCVNPDHLELGTYSDNMRDAVIRGRLKTKLTQTEVLRIKELRKTMTCSEIGKLYGVSRQAISLIDIKLISKVS